MKWFFLFTMLILSYDIAMADDEYAYKEVIAPNEVYSVGIGTPLIATKPCTHAEMRPSHGILSYGWQIHNSVISETNTE